MAQASTHIDLATSPAAMVYAGDVMHIDWAATMLDDAANRKAAELIVIFIMIVYLKYRCRIQDLICVVSKFVIRTVYP